MAKSHRIMIRPLKKDRNIKQVTLKEGYMWEEEGK
jgi:hypothetical protein